MRPARAPGRHHDEATAEVEFRDWLITAIDEDSRVREAILRLFAADRARKKPAPPPAATARAARTRRGGS